MESYLCTHEQEYLRNDTRMHVLIELVYAESANEARDLLRQTYPGFNTAAWSIKHISSQVKGAVTIANFIRKV